MLVQDRADVGQVLLFVPGAAVEHPVQVALELLDQQGVVMAPLGIEDTRIGAPGNGAVLSQDLQGAVVLAALVHGRVAELPQEAARLFHVLPVDDPHLGQLDLDAGDPLGFAFQEGGGTEGPAGAGVVLGRRRPVPQPGELLRASPAPRSATSPPAGNAGRPSWPSPALRRGHRSRPGWRPGPPGGNRVRRTSVPAPGIRSSPGRRVLRLRPMPAAVIWKRNRRATR